MLIKTMQKLLSRHWHQVLDGAQSHSASAADETLFSYNKADLMNQARRNQQSQIPLEININTTSASVKEHVADYISDKVSVIYETLPITNGQQSSNACKHQNNVVSLPDLMDSQTENLLTQFMQQERKQRFIEEHNQQLKYYLHQVKQIRDELKNLCASIDSVNHEPLLEHAEYREISEDFLCQTKLLTKLMQQFQAEKTRLTAKREIYKPILQLVLRFHPKRQTHLSQEILVFIDKQMLLLEKMNQCYDKLMIAASGLLSRIEVQVDAIREVLKPKQAKASAQDARAASKTLDFAAPLSNLILGNDFNLIELRKFVAQESH